MLRLGYCTGSLGTAAGKLAVVTLRAPALAVATRRLSQSLSIVDVAIILGRVIPDAGVWLAVLAQGDADRAEEAHSFQPAADLVIAIPTFSLGLSAAA